jgi:hypothetical protein
MSISQDRLTTAIPFSILSLISIATSARLLRVLTARLIPLASTKYSEDLTPPNLSYPTGIDYAMSASW